MHINELPPELLTCILKLLVPADEDLRRDGCTEGAKWHVNEHLHPFLELRHVCKRFEAVILYLLFGPSGVDQEVSKHWPAHSLHQFFGAFAISSGLKLKLKLAPEPRTALLARLADVIACEQLSCLPKDLVVDAVTTLAARWKTVSLKESIKDREDAAWYEARYSDDWDERTIHSAAVTVAAFLGQTDLLRHLLADRFNDGCVTGYDSDESRDTISGCSDAGDLDNWSDDWGFYDRPPDCYASSTGSGDSADESDERPRSPHNQHYYARTYSQSRLTLGRPIWAAAIANRVDVVRYLLSEGMFDKEVPQYPMQNIVKDRTVRQILLNMPEVVTEFSLLSGRISRFQPRSFFKFIARGYGHLVDLLLDSGVTYYAYTRQVPPEGESHESRRPHVFGRLTRSARLDVRKEWSPLWRKECSPELMRTALFIDAVSAGQQAIYDRLLTAGIDYSLQYGPVVDTNLGSFTALGAAAFYGNEALMHRLLEAGAPVDTAFTIDHSGDHRYFRWMYRKLPSASPMALAAASSQPKAATLVDLLLQKGADVEALRSQHVTPLHAACLKINGLAEATVLLKHGADPNGCGNRLFGSTGPLFAATSQQNVELVALLLQHGADPNMVPTCALPEGETEHYVSPLAVAARAGSLPIAKLLVEAGADVNNTGQPKGYDIPDRWTPAQIARENRHLEIEQLLLALGSQATYDRQVPDRLWSLINSSVYWENFTLAGFGITQGGDDEMVKEAAHMSRR